MGGKKNWNSIKYTKYNGIILFCSDIGIVQYSNMIIVVFSNMLACTAKDIVNTQ